MAKENKKEVSFVEGPIFQSLIRFALPVLGALILQAAWAVCTKKNHERTSLTILSHTESRNMGSPVFRLF